MLQGSCLCGAVSWRLDNTPASVTACNCTACRRYGTLWAYGHAGEDVHLIGETQAYARGKSLSFLFCPRCGCLASWLGSTVDGQGRRRQAVNLRLSEPEAIAQLPIDHFDGLHSFKDLPSDGRCVADLWF